jgi:hypothetical protein
MPRSNYKVITVSPEVFDVLKSVQQELEGDDPLKLRQVSMGKTIQYIISDWDSQHKNK